MDFVVHLVTIVSDVATVALEIYLIYSQEPRKRARENMYHLRIGSYTSTHTP